MTAGSNRLEFSDLHFEDLKKLVNPTEREKNNIMEFARLLDSISIKFSELHKCSAERLTTISKNSEFAVNLPGDEYYTHDLFATAINNLNGNKNQSVYGNKISVDYIFDETQQQSHKLNFLYKGRLPTEAKNLLNAAHDAGNIYSGKPGNFTMSFNDPLQLIEFATKISNSEDVKLTIVKEHEAELKKVPPANQTVKFTREKLENMIKEKNSKEIKPVDNTLNLVERGNSKLSWWTREGCLE